MSQSTEKTEELYYVRNMGLFEGNAPLWWKYNNHGYTPYLNGARRFDAETAAKIVGSNPNKYQMYSCTEINRKLHHVVHEADLQYLDSPDSLWDFPHAKVDL